MNVKSEINNNLSIYVLRCDKNALRDHYLTVVYLIDVCDVRDKTSIEVIPVSTDMPSQIILIK